MKKIILVGIMFMMFMGVVSASSINGEYKGNPVVKILNNGVEVVADDTPAMIYDNRTMVPIYLLKKIGATVTWDLDNYSADVRFPQPDTSKLDLTREYAALTDYYSALQHLSDSLHITYANLVIDISLISQNINIDGQLKNANDVLTNSINEFNRLKGNKDGVVLNAGRFNIVDISNIIDKIFQNYNSSINSFKTSLDKIKSYNTNTNYINEFNSNAAEGEKYYLAAAVDAYNGYFKYFQLTQTGSSSNVQTDTPNPTPVPTPSPRPLPTTAPDSVYLPIDNTPNAIESTIDGEFTGWSGETIFKLLNGQIWQQSSYAYAYYYYYSPKVIIYSSSGGYKMKVDGIDDTIYVKRIK